MHTDRAVAGSGASWAGPIPDVPADVSDDRIDHVGGPPALGRSVLGFGRTYRSTASITSPVVAFQTVNKAGSVVEEYRVAFLFAFRIDAGHFVGVDCDLHTVYLDDDVNLPLLSSLNWAQMRWPELPVAPLETLFSMTGTGTSHRSPRPRSSGKTGSSHDQYLRHRSRGRRYPPGPIPGAIGRGRWRCSIAPPSVHALGLEYDAR